MCPYHISGKSVFIPSQLYTLRMANQNFPQDGILTAPPVRIIVKVELHCTFSMKTCYNMFNMTEGQTFAV